MQKLDKDRNVTQEYLDYISSLDRKDLETFYIGADLLVDRLNNIIKEIEDFCIAMGKMYEEDYKDADIASIFNICMLDKIKELKGDE